MICAGRANNKAGAKSGRSGGRGVFFPFSLPPPRPRFSLAPFSVQLKRIMETHTTSTLTFVDEAVNSVVKFGAMVRCLAKKGRSGSL